MLTNEQSNAVRSNHKKILVRAGAGTGKTEVLVRRMIRLLEEEQDLSINNFAIITFTNKATENIQDRIKQYLYLKWENEQNDELKERFRYELEMINSAQISTIHSFCKSILNTAGPFQTEQLHYAPKYKVSEGVLYDAITHVINKWLTNNKDGGLSLLEYLPPHKIRKELLQLYRKIRSDGIPFKLVKEETENSILFDEYGKAKKVKHELLCLLTDLEKEHRRRKLNQLSTDDLLEYTYHLLVENPEIIERVKNRYKHIFVDEFQDTSWFQTKIIQLLCSSEENVPSLFVVGDIKQSIYQFRGADPQSYKNVETWIKQEGQILSLQKNFRSVKPLVTYVNNMFQKIGNGEAFPDFEPENLVANDETDGVTQEYVKYIPDNGLEDADRVAVFIQEQIDAGECYGDFAILFRTNNNIINYQEKLKEYNIPAQVVGAGNFYQKKEISEVYKLIRFLITPNNPVVRSEALETDYLRFSRIHLEELYDHFKTFVDYYSVAQILEELYRYTNIRTYYNQIGDNQALANIDKLKELSRSVHLSENLQLVNFVDYLSSKIMLDKEEKQADIVDHDVNEVTLITIHKAKGLEFPIVILPDLNRALFSERLVPTILYSEKTGIEFSISSHANNNGAGNEWHVTSENYENIKDRYLKSYLAEEARVLYVALTRAEKHLYFLRYDNKVKKHNYGNENQYQQLLGEGIGELKRKRLDYQDELNAVLNNTNQKSSSLDSSKWMHQEEAKRAFLKHGNGVLEMATGTGKTRTAINILNHLLMEEKIETVIITVNGTDLLDQWASEIRKHTSLNIFRNYESYKELGSFQTFPEESALIVSRRSLLAALQTLNPEIQQKTLIICDEVHGLGSPSLIRDVSGKIKKIKYRLGLSATPEREYDEDGNKFIEAEIGKVVYKFGLDDAIRKGILCEFNYYPIRFELTEDDRIKIKKIIKSHFARKRAGESVSDELLYTELARVKKTSLGKIDPFREFIRTHQDLLKRSIIFVETKGFGVKIQELILPYIGNYHTYYGEDKRELLLQFSDSDLDCLITSKRISEGIDIQSVENVLLFTADRSKLQTIQRIGRCLRTDPNNLTKVANVVDFIEINDDLDTEEANITTDEERMMWLTELSNVKKVANTIE